MRLYYVPKTRATRPRWVLEELGVPYELVRLDPGRGETRAPAHLQRQPLGHVPVLEDGATRIFESGAICLHLADRFPEKGLAPPAGTPERAILYQWIFFVLTEIEPHLAVMSAQRRKPEAERDAALVEASRAQAGRAVRALEPALRAGPWLLGASFTVGDVIVGSLLLWAKALGVAEGRPDEADPERAGGTGGPAQAAPPSPINEYVARLRERPAWRRATAD